jgi:sterol desaturase/sphingolipid hydroxylase (fatty acid hydroxylase superfamily)
MWQVFRGRVNRSASMPINKFLYFGDFVAIPVAVAVLTYFALTSGGLWAVPDFAVSLLIGLATWTLVEYAIHRFIYHRAPLFSALHDSHHQAPNESSEFRHSYRAASSSRSAIFL